MKINTTNVDNKGHKPILDLHSNMVSMDSGIKNDIRSNATKGGNTSVKRDVHDNGSIGPGQSVKGLVIGKGKGKKVNFPN